MSRKAFGLILAAALSFSWAVPLRAMSAGPSHACCAGGKAPMPMPAGQDVPACCRAPEAMPPVVSAAAQAPAPALLACVVIVADAPRVIWAAPAPNVAASPQAPPGTHSGLSPPSSGL
ncbi:MAG: hypothetical protein AAB262_06165 [Elusimicrobiota bacterium]